MKNPSLEKEPPLPLQTLLSPYKENSLITCYMGSISHGVYDEKTGIDDVDVMNILVPPVHNLLGLYEWSHRETKSIMQEEWDVTIYSIKKFIGLLLKGNPNVVGVLWLHPECYIDVSPEGKDLIAHREWFLFREMFKVFAGYAHDQIKKMTHCKYEGYMGEKRKKLVDKFGYDCKNAAHAIRLLRMCIECLNTGEFNVYREDRQELLGIKRGNWTQDQIERECNRLFQEAQEAYNHSKLPQWPEFEKAEKWLIETQKNLILKNA